MNQAKKIYNKASFQHRDMTLKNKNPASDFIQTRDNYQQYNVISMDYISFGDFPKCFLKTVLKYPMDEKPQSSLTSVTLYLWL
jgi:hypothetical protein